MTIKDIKKKTCITHGCTNKPAGWVVIGGEKLIPVCRKCMPGIKEMLLVLKEMCNPKPKLE